MAVLQLLTGEPMHPYGIRQRIQEWGKGLVVNVTQHNVIYQTMQRLERAGLIALRKTTRDGRRPERTVYQATDEGVTTVKRWLLEMLSIPAKEYPEFPAALAFLDAISHEEKLRALDARVTAIEENIARMKRDVEARVADFPGGVDRIYLVEVEYIQAMWEAELAWVRRLLDDLSSGRLT
jgi:DNA-binding PadR family transcriptional regulator